MRIDQIPYGHENAVQRPANASEDRALRAEIEAANHNGDCIINVGEGYYRPIPGDSIDDRELNEYLAKERSREHAIRKKRHAMMAAYCRREHGIFIDDTEAVDNLNDLIRAERTNRYKGGALKEKNEKYVREAIKHCLRGVHITKPVYMDYTWKEQNQRRDLDNISSFGRKVIQDALVKEGVLQNDNWKCIKGFSDRFVIDKWHPGVVVCIREILDE